MKKRLHSQSLGWPCLVVLIGAAGLLGRTPATCGPDAPTSVPDNRIPDHLGSLLPRPDDEAGFRSLFGRDASDGWAQCGPGGFTLTQGVATSHGGMGLWYVVRINGETVTVWTDPTLRSSAGYFGLQNYQDVKGVQHRRLRIKELP